MLWEGDVVFIIRSLRSIVYVINVTFVTNNAYSKFFGTAQRFQAPRFSDSGKRFCGGATMSARSNGLRSLKFHAAWAPAFLTFNFKGWRALRVLFETSNVRDD